MFLKLMLTNGAEREGTEMNQILIDPEFRSLIPSLTKEELEQLEQNLIKDGCRDALIVWNGILLDGHNRYEICSKHNIIYRTEEKHFESRNEAKEWIIRNQFGRRNLSAFDRSKLALRLKELIQAKAKEKQRDAGGDHGNQYTGGKVPLMQKSAEAAEIFETRDSVSQKSTETNQGKEIDLLPSAEANPIVTREEIAKLAGVSHDTIDKVKVIEKEATPEQKAKLSTGETKINTVFTDIQANKAVEKYPELKEFPKKETIQTAKKLDQMPEPTRLEVAKKIAETKEVPPEVKGDISFMFEPGYEPPVERVKRDPVVRLRNVIYQFQILFNSVTKWHGMETAVKDNDYEDLVYVSNSLTSMIEVMNRWQAIVSTEIKNNGKIRRIK
jgi:hypothetical protein